jgi:hypothetical protein
VTESLPNSLNLGWVPLNSIPAKLHLQTSFSIALRFQNVFKTDPKIYEKRGLEGSPSRVES